MVRSPRDLSFRHELERRALAIYLKAQRRRAEALALEKESKGLQVRARSKDVGTLPPRKRRKASAGAHVSAAKVRSTLPFYVVLHARDLSPPEWARRQSSPSIGVETVRSWLKAKGKGGRQIPEFWADRIAAEFKDEKGNSLVPARDSSWPCGIRRG